MERMMASKMARSIAYLKYLLLRWSARYRFDPIAFTNDAGKLKNIVSQSGRRTRRSAWVIVGGLFAEVLILLWYAPEKTWAETALLIACNLAIAAGVFGEDHFAHLSGEAATRLQQLSDERIAAAEDRAAQAHAQAAGSMAMAGDAKNRALRLQKDIAEANARASEAQLALEKFKAPRHLSGEQWASICEKIRAFGPQQFDLAANNSDPEAQRMANSILFHLGTVAGWRQIDWKQHGAMVLKWSIPQLADWGINTMTIGVEIQVVPKERERFAPVAKALAEALTAEGVETKMHITGSHSSNADTVHILVGKKP
jgi:hypothetical protein